MTPMRRLAGIAVLALLAGGAVLACSGGSADGGDRRGKKLYAAMGCLACHGATGAGGALAPPLEDLGQHWTRERIAVYLSDPSGWVEKDERLKALKQRYSLQMPALTIAEEDRLVLADHVLELSARL